MSAEHLIAGIEAQYTAEFINLSKPKTTITKNGRRRKDEDREDIFADGTLENAWLADQCILLAQAVCSDDPNAKELALDIMLTLNPTDSHTDELIANPALAAISPNSSVYDHQRQQSMKRLQRRGQTKAKHIHQHVPCGRFVEQCDYCLKEGRNAPWIKAVPTCVNGHPWTPENTYTNGKVFDGLVAALACKLCRREKYAAGRKSRLIEGRTSARHGKMTLELANKIKGEISDNTQTALAKKYGVSQSLVWQVVSDRWSGFKLTEEAL